MLAAAVILSAATFGVAQQSGESVLIREAQDQDLYVAGSEVRVLAAVEGDVVAAGKIVAIEARVAEDVIAAGESVSIRAAVGDDVRAAGNTVRIAAPVAGHVVAAGETVSIEPGQRVEDFAWLAGETVEVSGSVGALRAAGERIFLNGVVRGDAELMGSSIELGPDAVVEGDLHYGSEDPPTLQEGARVTGQLVAGEAPSLDEDESSAGFSIVSLLALIVGIAALRFLFPRAVPQVAEVARVNWLLSLGIGAGALLLVPAVAVLLFITSVGWMLGLLVLLGYLSALLAGGLVGLYAVGATGLHLTGREAVAPWLEIMVIAVTVVVVRAVSAIPFLGIVSFAVLLLGFGALSLHAFRRYRAGFARREPAG